MKLIGSLTSPYVRKVRVVMAEKKLDYRFEVMSLTVVWLVLISSGVLLSVAFARRV